LIVTTITYDVGKPGPDFGQVQECGRVKSVIGTLTLSSEIPSLPN
jgi:hypothetical protein